MGKEHSWSESIINSSIGAQYLKSLYFVVTVVTTTGYGDITPQNNNEIQMLLVLIIAGNMLYAAVIGTISSWMGSAHARNLSHFNQLREINKFCNYYNLNEDLINNINKYFNTSFAAREREELTRKFPKKLRKKYCMELYGAAMQSIGYFSGFTNPEIQGLLSHSTTMVN